MSTPRRRAWFAAAVAAAAALGYFMLFRSDESEVLARVDRLARVLGSPPSGESALERRARLARELAPLVAGDAVVELDGSTRIRGRDALATLASDGVAPDERVELELSSPELRVEDGSAVARGQGVLVRKRSNGLVRDVRAYRALFERRAGKWLLVSVDVARATEEEPEARP